MSKRVVRGLAPALFLTLAAVPAIAQEQEEEKQEQGQYQEAAAESMDAMMEAWQKAGAPGEPHEELAATTGTWNAEVKMWMDPDGDPMTSTGTMTREMIMDGRYLKETYEGDMMGQPFTGQGLTAYNNITGEYESTWIDNMSTAIYTFRGSKEGNKIVMTGEYRDPMSGETVRSRGELEMLSDTEEKYTSYEDRGEGMVKVMEIVYTKQN